MELKELPTNYKDWLMAREQHLSNDLQRSEYTVDLFRQYKKNLGSIRYKILVESQMLVVPDKVKEMLHFRKFSLLLPAVPFYKLARKLNLDAFIKAVLLPPAYQKEINELDIVT
jgi:hypothetical protein